MKNLIFTSALLTLSIISVFANGHNSLLSSAGNKAYAAEDKVKCGVLNDLPGGVNLCDKKGPNALNEVINDIANVLIGLIGLVLAIVIIVSAIQIIASGGSPDAMKSAKNRLTQAAISLGLLISFRAIIALLGIR